MGLPTVTPSPSSPRLRRLPLWRNRDYMLLWSGQIVSAVGSQVSQLAFPLLIYAVTGSAAQMGFTAALRGIPYVMLMLPAGVLVDRWDRKRVMILCDTGRAIALGSIPLALVTHHLTLAQIYLVSLVEGTLFVFFSLSEIASLPRVVPPDQLPSASAQSQVTDSVAVLLGPALGGVLISASNALPFVADAISYAGSVASLFFIRARFQGKREREPVTPKKLWQEVSESLVWLWREPVLRVLAILTGGLILPSIGYSLIIIVLARSQHASNVAIGLIFAAGGLGSMVGAVAAGPIQRRFSFSRIVVISTWIWALTWLLFAVAPNPIVLTVVAMLSYIIVPIYMATQFSYRLTSIPDELQGRVNSVYRLIAFGSQPLGLAVTGMLLQAIGPVPTVLVLFVPQLGCAVAVSLNRHIRGAGLRTEID